MIKVSLLSVQLQNAQSVILTPETSAQQVSLIGRAANCELILDSVEVSRIHGKIQFQSGQYYYSDLGSANGSCINNKELAAEQSYCLKVGDSISIGDFLLLVEAIEIAPTEAQLSQNYGSQIPQSYRASEHQQNRNSHQNSTEKFLRCVRITHETADAKTFTFVAEPVAEPMAEPVAEPAIVFDYQPGQFVNLELEINGDTVLRSYSISSSPTRPYTLEITVKRVPAPIDQPHAPPGLVSNWLHDTLKVGSRVKISGILGKFTCFPNPALKLLMISAGSGITPMMSMSRWIADTAGETDVVFFHSARTPGDIIFRQELEFMAARLDNFHLAIATTQSQSGQPWYGYRGRLNEAMLQLIAPDFRDRTVYVCGPEGFMQSVKTMLERLNFPMQNYFEESFGGAKKAKKAKTKMAEAMPQMPAVPAVILTSASTQPIVRFAQSEKEVATDGTESILELAEQVNIKIRNNCRQGVCGACKKRKLEGSVRYESSPDGLDTDEQAAGFVLTCVAMPVDRVVVDV